MRPVNNFSLRPADHPAKLASIGRAAGAPAQRIVGHAANLSEPQDLKRRRSWNNPARHGINLTRLEFLLIA